MKSASEYDVKNIKLNRLEQLSRKFTIDNQAGCWNWDGAKNKYGYGCVRIGQRTLKAHRVIFSVVRSIPVVGMVCDHLCRNHACVNPKHIELVDTKTNLGRGTNYWAVRDKCKHGHMFSSQNTYYETRNGRTSRVCRKCRIIRIAEYRQRLKLTATAK